MHPTPIADLELCNRTVGLHQMLVFQVQNLSEHDQQTVTQPPVADSCQPAVCHGQ
jgi:hypothetical protein